MVDDWVTIKIPRELAEQIDKIIEDQSLGYTKKAQFTSEAIRKLLQEYYPRFEHVNFEQNCIRLIDNEKPKGSPFIEIRLNGGKLYCDTCEKNTCEHISAAWNDEEIKEKLLKKGLKQ